MSAILSLRWNICCLVLALLFGYSQQSYAQNAKNTRKLLTRKWTMDQKFMKKEIRKIFERQAPNQDFDSPEIQASLAPVFEMIESLTLDIRSNGEIIASMKKREDKDQWELAPDGKTLTLTHYGNQRKMIIKEISKKHLLLENVGIAELPMMRFVPAKK